MKKPLIILLILICSCSTVYNQIIKGTILDKFKENPIDYAIVYINGTFVVTNADKNGNFDEFGIRFSGKMARQQIADRLPNEYSIK